MWHSGGLTTLGECFERVADKFIESIDELDGIDITTSDIPFFHWVGEEDKSLFPQHVKYNKEAYAKNMSPMP